MTGDTMVGLRSGAAHTWAAICTATNWVLLWTELYEACTNDVLPGSPTSVAFLFERSHQPHGRRRALPDNWWTWPVQLVVPNSGPNITSAYAVLEFLVVVAGAVLIATVEAARADAPRQDYGSALASRPVLLVSGVSVPSGVVPGATALDPEWVGGSVEQGSAGDRGWRAGTRGIPAVDALRELSAVHDRSHAGHADVGH